MHPRENHLKVLLLCSSFNGLSQRTWTELRGAGHDVRVQLVGDPEAAIGAAAALEPDVILCPFIKERVPAEIWQRYRTIIIHPGPPGDRGPSSLDWAISAAEPSWGVTALQAVEEMDAGPIWGYRTFTLPADPPRKSSLYNGASPRPRSSWCTRWWPRPPTARSCRASWSTVPRTCVAGCVR